MQVENTTGNSTTVGESVIDSPILVEEQTTYYYSPLGQKVRLGSRTIVIEQIKKFSMLPKDPKAKQIRDEVTKKIGCQWKKGTRDVIRGLTAVEEQLYLPAIIGLKPEHDEWETQVKNFWYNYTIPVQADKGIKLEAGFQLKRGSTTEVEPINVTDYIKYRFAMENSKVAKEDEDNLITYDFQLMDSEREAALHEESFSTRKRAEAAFIKIVTESEKIQDYRDRIDWVLEVYGGDYGRGMSVYGLSDIRKQLELEKIKDKDPAKFVEILNDRDLGSKAIIRKAITLGKITNEGTTYFYANMTMGNSQKAAIAWLNDPNNSHHKLIIMEAIKGVNI